MIRQGRHDHDHDEGARQATVFPRAILFDLDDTLFDHRRASAAAVAEMHREHGADLPLEAFRTRHAEVLEVFHTRVLTGELTLDQARVARMQALFASFARPIDDETAARAARLYRVQYQANRFLVAGARELLDHLAPRCRLGIVSNNTTEEQIEKLRVLGIASYFDAVVTSEDVGFTKPDPRIFAPALQRLGASADECVFVGDSWINDIEGAAAAGIAAVWLARDPEAPAMVRAPGRKRLESHVNAGASISRVAAVASLTPAEAVTAALQKAFANCAPGVPRPERMGSSAY